MARGLNRAWGMVPKVGASITMAAAMPALVVTLVMNTASVMTTANNQTTRVAVVAS